MRSVYLKVTGKVQGVFFRASAQKQAARLNLKGWVKNTEDFVEIMVNGESTNVEAFIQWASVGPDRANVKNIEVKDAEAGNFKDFEIIR